MTSTLRPLWLVLLMMLGSACGKRSAPPTGPYDLIVTGTELDDWLWAREKVLVAKLYAAEQQVGAPQQARVSMGTLTLTWPKAVQPETPYVLRYYFDMIENGKCDDEEPGFVHAFVSGPGTTTAVLPPGDEALKQNLCSYF